MSFHACRKTISTNHHGIFPNFTKKSPLTIHTSRIIHQTLTLKCTSYLARKCHNTVQNIKLIITIRINLSISWNHTLVISWSWTFTVWNSEVCTKLRRIASGYHIVSWHISVHSPIIRYLITQIQQE